MIFNAVMFHAAWHCLWDWSTDCTLRRECSLVSRLVPLLHSLLSGQWTQSHKWLIVIWYSVCANNGNIILIYAHLLAHLKFLYVDPTWPSSGLMGTMVYVTCMSSHFPVSAAWLVKVHTYKWSSGAHSWCRHDICM